MLKVVIFDFDGLLVNSQPAQYKAHQEAFEQYGVFLSHNDWLKWVSESYTIDLWIATHHLDAPAKEIKSKKNAFYLDLLPTIELREGAEDLVKVLSKKYALCMASHSSANSIKNILGRLALLKFFSDIISLMPGIRGKPAPDLYLEAAKRMNANPNECVAIEDSISGAKAARTAGMPCVICPDPNFPSPEITLESGLYIAEDLEDVQYGIEMFSQQML